jgi:putative ABC transport system ATP-binding protein
VTGPLGPPVPLGVPGARPGGVAIAAGTVPPILVDVAGVTRTFGAGATAVPALRGVTLQVRQGQLAALCGRSGSGKTTLLNIIGGLDRPDAGRVGIGGRAISSLGERDRTLMRRSEVAFIFQTFGLIPMLSAAENVGLPLRIAGQRPREREARVGLLLDLVGLAGHARQRPAELSGGQQQRVAIARALAGRPRLLIADEPTGQLDSETGRQVMRLLCTVVRAEGVTALIATHDPAFTRLADQVLWLEDGRVRPGAPPAAPPAGGQERAG